MPEAPHPNPEPQPPPEVRGILPNKGFSNGGTEVRIAGLFYSAVIKVTFGSVDAPDFTVKNLGNLQSILVNSPPGTGTVDVRVTTQYGTSLIVPDDKFTYMSPPPVILSLPNGEDTGTWFSGCVIIGTGFTGVTQVLFGLIPAYGFNFFSDSKITANAPPQAPGFCGPVDVRVVTPYGTSAITPNDRFTYKQEECPSVFNINPKNGPPQGGNTVTISGSGLLNATVIMFGKVEAEFTPCIPLNTDNEIIVTAPPGEGTVNITVTAPGGVSVPSPNSQYTYE